MERFVHHACEFFFAGAATLPAFLLHAEEPALAVMSLVALLVAGAVCGIGDPEAPHRQIDRAAMPLAGKPLTAEAKRQWQLAQTP